MKDHNDHLDDTKPSEEFMIALKKLKPIWLDDTTTDDIEILSKAYNDLIALGERDGLSLDFVNSKLYDRVVNCRGCNQEFIVYTRHDLLCLGLWASTEVGIH